MRPDWRKLLEKWSAAGLIDAELVDRITAFENREAQPERLDWPVALALTLGGIAIGAGLLLFVAANWDRISPSTRFGLVFFFVAIFHFAGALSGRDSQAFQSALHAIGTVGLGAGIALAGQIFQLPVDWADGTMLWAAGAVLAWALLRDTPQLVLSGVLVPLWLASEFGTRLPKHPRELLGGLLLLSIVYVGAVSADLTSNMRTAFLWIGAVAVLPLTIVTSSGWLPPPQVGLQFVTLASPILLAWILRKGEAWIPALFAVWIVVLGEFTTRYLFLVDLWCAAGSMGLIAWGWRDGRKERINLGVAAFALSVLFFYVSSVLDKLGRSASLITMGILLLAGGWALERLRRRLVSAV